MLLFGAPPSYQLASKSYFVSISTLLPFENITNTLVDIKMTMVNIGIEKSVEINPNVIFAIFTTVPTAEILEKAMKEDFEKMQTTGIL